MSELETSAAELAEPEKKGKRKSEMTDEQLAVFLEQQNRMAVGHLSDEIAAKQDDNLDRYLGVPYGDEEEGTSNAISMDVAEVVDWALPDLLEPFISGDRIVEYEPATQKDEAWVEQAGDLANHTFFSDNPGVLILHDVIKTALIQKIGVIKTVWEDEDKVEEQHLTGLSILNVQELQQDKSVTIKESTAEPVDMAMLDPAVQQAFVDGKVYTVELEHTKRGGCSKIYAVPPEQFKVSQRVDDLRRAEYCCHEVERRRYELIDMGFDPEKVASLKETVTRETRRQDKRFRDEFRDETTSTNRSSDLLTLCEEYFQVDADGDGRAELLQVFRVGKTILSREEVDENPFDTWSADRIPNRLIGLGLADKVKQTQRIKTHLTRQMLDNVYLSNNPRIEVPDGAAGENTIEDLLTYRVGGLIRTKGQGGMMRPIEVPDRSGVALNAIQYMDAVREQQSGIVRNGMSIGSEAIDPTTATEARKEDRSEQSRKKLMTRMIAETLLVPVFRKILKNIVRYQDFERTLKLRGKWVSMDPRSWHADLAAKAATGLGHANKDEMMASSNALLQAQVQAHMMGLANEKNLFNGAKMLCQALGIKQPEQYFLDPESPEGQQALQAKAQAPDPHMAKVQGQLQISQAQQQAKAQQAQMDLQQKAALSQQQMQFDQQMAIANQKFEMQKHYLQQQVDAAFDQGKAQADAATQMAKISRDHQSDMIKIQTEAQIAREKMAAEFEMAREQLAAETQIAREKNRMMASAKTGLNGKVSMGGGQRFGGSVAS